MVRFVCFKFFFVFVGVRVIFIIVVFFVLRYGIFGESVVNYEVI